MISSTMDMAPFFDVSDSWHGMSSHQMLMYAFWSYDFVPILRTPSIAFRELKYSVKMSYSLQSHCRVVWTYL